MSFFISEVLAEGAPAAAGVQGDPTTGFIFMIGLVVLFYFMLIRPQQKRAKEHKKLISELAKGDEVITNGGLIGKITKVGEQYLTLEITDNVEVKLQNNAIATVLPKGSLKAANKD